MPDSEYATDFFISHADADLKWAEWMAAELEDAGYGVIVKARDFRPGENTLLRHDEALATSRHTICVLSHSYVSSEVAARTAAQYQDLTGKERALIPVKVAACDPPPLLRPTIAIDLSDVTKPAEARRLLLDGVASRADQTAGSGFPRARTVKPRFPNAPHEVLELRGHRADRYFTGRDDELAALHQALRAGRPTSAVQVISGLGGQGKTRLAVEYAVRHVAAYDLIWLIRAEDPATMRGDYVELAQELGLASEKDDQAISALRRELLRRREWLLIFDNAEDSAELLSLLPETHSGHVLITSRRRDWPQGEVRYLDVLPVHAATEYLQRRGPVADRDTARDIANALGCLPLALVQAASVIADGMPPADYLDLLHRQSPELFAEGRTPEHEMTVDSTWRVSVDRLARRSAAALALFRLSAFLAADTIPLGRLAANAVMPAELAEALGNPILLSKATAALTEYSLAETADGTLSIHRLVQEVTRAELGEDRPRWVSIALATVIGALPGDEEDPKTWQVYEDVLAHALACAEHASRLQIDIAVTVGLLNRVARYLLARGRLESADAVLEQALTTAIRLNYNDPVYLSCRSTYAGLLFDQGDIPSARAVYEEVYQARRRILGSDDPETLRAGRDLVQALYFEGHQAQAARLHDWLVEAFTEVLGSDDLETITALAYKATMLRHAGQLKQARTLEERVLEVRTWRLGEKHPDTILARMNLAYTLHDLGDLEQARALEEQVLEGRIKVLGEDHPYTLGAKAALGSTLYAMGELRQARVLAEEVLAARIRLLGEEHPDTLDAKANLASVWSKFGKLAKARALEEQVLEGRIRALGEDHPSTLRARAHLASTLSGLGEPVGACVLNEQVLAARIRLLGEEHPDTLDAKADLAATMCDIGELKRARVLAEEVLAARIGLLGEEHPDTLDAKASLAETLCMMLDVDQGRALWEEVLAARIRLLGGEHPDTLDAKAGLAVTMYASRELDQARTLGEEVLDARVRLLGKDHPDTVEAMESLSLTLSRLDELDRARTLQESVVKVRLAALGEENTRTLSAKAHLAGILIEQGNNKKANSLLAECLDTSLRAFGKKHTATTEAAWRLVESCGPHEVNRQRALVLTYLSWLAHARSNQLTASQKEIKEGIKGIVHGPKSSGRSKKQSLPTRKQSPSRLKKRK